MGSDTAEPIEQWTAKRRVALVVSILKGDTSVAEATRQHGLTVAEVEDWREKFLLGAENAIRTGPKDEEALKDEQVKKLKQKRWLVHQRVCTPRPRVRGWVSRASRSNERWAMDVTHLPCGQDGWAHLVAVIDCHDRKVIGYEFALRSRAKEVEWEVEAACLTGFGTLRLVEAPFLLSDNGLIFQCLVQYRAQESTQVA
jgi:transposase InsO family protein